jgi:hypothetical protein
VPRLAVVFDTNVYVTIAGERFTELRRRERSHSVIAVASPWVAQELLAHLTDPDPRDVGRARAALRRMAEHCRRYDGSRPHLEFFGDINQQIIATLTGVVLPEDHSVWEMLAKVVGFVVDAPDVQALQEERDVLAAIAQHVSDSEQRFVNNVWELLIRVFVPDAEGWDAVACDPDLRERILGHLAGEGGEHALAEVLADGARELLAGLRPELPALDWAAEFRRWFPTPLRIERNLLQQVIGAGLDLRRSEHANTLWDIRIAFSTTIGAHFRGAPVWLVTGDGRFLTAAREAGASSAILSPDEYEAALAQRELFSRP